MKNSIYLISFLYSYLFGSFIFPQHYLYTSDVIDYGINITKPKLINPFCFDGYIEINWDKYWDDNECNCFSVIPHSGSVYWDIYFSTDRVCASTKENIKYTICYKGPTFREDIFVPNVSLDQFVKNPALFAGYVVKNSSFEIEYDKHCYHKYPPSGKYWTDIELIDLRQALHDLVQNELTSKLPSIKVYIVLYDYKSKLDLPYTNYRTKLNIKIINPINVPYKEIIDQIVKKYLKDQFPKTEITRPGGLSSKFFDRETFNVSQESNSNYNRTEFNFNEFEINTLPNVQTEYKLKVFASVEGYFPFEGVVTLPKNDSNVTLEIYLSDDNKIKIKNSDRVKIK